MHRNTIYIQNISHLSTEHNLNEKKNRTNYINK